VIVIYDYWDELDLWIEQYALNNTLRAAMERCRQALLNLFEPIMQPICNWLTKVNKRFFREVENE